MPNLLIFLYVNTYAALNDICNIFGALLVIKERPCFFVDNIDNLLIVAGAVMCRIDEILSNLRMLFR